MGAFGTVLFVFLMLFAIGFHEFGHFASAKRFGIKVERFFIGFGPKIWSFKRGETEYGVNWLPIGGYVRIAGMNPFEEIPPEDAGRVFKAKPAWQRAIVLAAGSTMHFILALAVVAGIFLVSGRPDKAEITTSIEAVSPGTPAAAAGFMHGDKIVSVAGQPVPGWETVRNAIRAHPGEAVVFGIMRRGTFLRLTATLQSSTPGKEQVGFLGVEPVARNEPVGVLEVVPQSGAFVGRVAWDSLRSLGRVVAPSTFKHLFNVATGKEKRSAADPASVVGIARAAGSFDFTGLLMLFVVFNVFVGVANLLPLPPLDGGHLAVLAYEKVRGRPVDMRKLIPITATVVTVFVSLFVLLFYLDIVRPLPAIPG